METEGEVVLNIEERTQPIKINLVFTTWTTSKILCPRVLNWGGSCNYQQIMIDQVSHPFKENDFRTIFFGLEPSY